LYHNSSHRELDGRTPAGEWERLLPDYGTPHLADRNRYRVTFGLHRSREVSQYGIAHCGLYYTNALVDHHYLHGLGKLVVAGDGVALVFISVKIGETWREAGCVDAEMIGETMMGWFDA